MNGGDPPSEFPKVASLDMLRTMFFQSGMANGGNAGVAGMTPGNMLGLMQNPFGEQSEFSEFGTAVHAKYGEYDDNRIHTTECGR